MTIKVFSDTTKEDFDTFIYAAKFGLEHPLVQYNSGLFDWWSSEEGGDYWINVSYGSTPLSDAIPKLEKYRDEIFGKE